MRGPAGRARVVGVTPVEMRLRITCAEPLSGVVVAGDRELGFEGWTGLAGALQSVLAAASGAVPSSTAARPLRPDTPSLP